MKIDDESGYESPAPAPSSTMHGQTSEAFISYVKKKHPLGPITNDQILLTVSTMQHAYAVDQVSVNMAYNMKIKDAWGPIHPSPKDQPKKMRASQILKQQKIDPATQLKQLKGTTSPAGIERISTTYETKTLQLNLKNSLLGDSVQSFIPMPTLTRSKSCSSLSGEKKTQAKLPSPPPGGKQVIGYFTSSMESLKVPRMKIAQPDTESVSRRPRVVFAHNPNPYRFNTGFRLLTTKQMKEYEEAKISEYQAKKTEVIANRQKECKNAWLRKIKGLSIDDFTKEGKVSAPELGHNVFI